MFVRFESIQKPNSYNDSPITSLSFMQHDVSLESSESRNHETVHPDLQSPTIMHHHHFGIDPAAQADLNNNNSNNGSLLLHQHLQYNNCSHCRSFDSDSISVVEDDSAKEIFAKDGWLAVGNARGIVGVSFTSTKSFNYTKNWCVPSCDQSSATVNESDSNNNNDNSNSSWAGKSSAECSGGRGQGTPSRASGGCFPGRTNYNLRGHRAEIIFVRWNEPFQKLATCDENGVIFIWIKYEGRWSIELINDRNTRVTDIAWSHDGRMALICYMDGFVLVGSVSGQRYWSSMLNLSDTAITCGVWSPNDQHVLFGTSNGHILVISVHGTFVTQVAVQDSLAITGLSWSCGKFYTSGRGGNHIGFSELHRLAVSFVDGTVFVMRNYDDLDPKIISTECLGIKMDWSSDGQVLAVGGHRVVRSENLMNGFTYKNVLNLYSRAVFEQHRPPFPIPPVRSEILSYDAQPLSAITWGNSDRRLYIACGQVLYVGWVFQNIPTLSFLARLKIHRYLKEESKVETVPVPEPLKCTISELFIPSICCYLPDYRHIRQFVFRPPPGKTRLYCTLMRHELEENCTPSGTNENSIYVLYLEYMGGLVPILKGKRSSKLKTEFFIYDPEQTREKHCGPQNHLTKTVTNNRFSSNRPSSAFASYLNTPESDSDESFIFPYLTPKTRKRLRCRSAQLRRYLSRNQDPMDENVAGQRPSTPNCFTTSTVANSPCPSSSLVIDDLPEQGKIVYVASNIWGTKFKFLGLSSMLPTHLGSMRYRTSFLHLQPRQMSLRIKELNTDNTTTVLPFDYDDCQSNSACDGTTKQLYGSSACLVSSDSEDECSDYVGCSSLNKGTSCTNTPAIVPMTPFKSVRNSMFFSAAGPANQMADAAQQQLDSRLVQPNTTIEVKLDQQQNQKPTQPICLKDARVKEECQSIVSRFANMNEELLTLQIYQNEYEKPVYSIELITGAHNRQQVSREPEYYHSPDESPYDTVTVSSAISSSIPTMVRQFKHQSFQSESPKHVSHLRHQSMKSAVTKSGSPNISPSKSIRQKILKESPRKSSVSYCSSEFSALSTQSYVEDAHQTSVICDNSATVPSSNSTNLSYPFKSDKLKSCSSEAYSASQHLLTSSPPLSCGFESSALSVEHKKQQQLPSFVNAFSSANHNNLNISDLFAQNDDLSNQNGYKLNSSSLSCSHKTPINGGIGGTMQTYHIYDDTSHFNNLNLSKSSTKKANSEKPPATPVHRRRKQFAQDANKKSSKSFELLLKTSYDLLEENNCEKEENHLNNVEQVVKLLSEKLLKAAKDKESLQPLTENLTYLNKPTLPKQSTLKHSLNDLNSESNIKSSSLPFGLTKMNSQSLKTPTKLSHDHNKSATSTMQKTNVSLSNNNLEMSNNEVNATVTPTKLENFKIWKNQSLPASPLKMIKSLKNELIQKSTNISKTDVTSEKRHSNGRHFFHSPNVIRKMRKKFSYLDCSSEDENSSDEEEMINNSSAASSVCQTPINLTPKLPRKMVKIKRKNKFNEVKTQEFTLRNKAPLWNEITQVYQLDFGGRVTQESAKNFQIEHNGQQVMQFGRIEKNAYTLDFEYPFSAVQALSVALANITQRFK